jgi:murein DD-endopeptidase MepM/ murein hydrolase activator NlpD
LSTKFIGVEGYGKIQPLQTKKRRKKFSFSGIILSILYLFLVLPVKTVKEFSFKQFKKTLTLKKVMTNFVTPVGAIALLVLTIGFWTNYIDFGLAVQWDGKTVATVTDSGVIQKAKEITNQKLSDDVDTSFTPVYQVAVVNEASSNPSQVSGAIVNADNNLSDNLAGLYINDELMGVCESADELNSKLEKLLEEDKNHYDSKSEVGFYNDVQVKEGIYSKDDVVTVDELVKKADKEELLQVLVKTDVVVSEKIPYETKVKYDKTKASSYKKVTKKGVNGVQKTTYRVSYLDGVQVDAVITQVKTTKKAVNKVVVKGKGSTSKSTDSVSSSGYLWPVPSVHSISSTYGYREGGEYHTGLDIADGNCYGATIVASRSGTVEWAGYDDSGYGNYVIIDHGDGYKTLYGHCSSVYVSKGQKVTQGQSIAAIGSTGQSTGNHCHFEVRTGDQRSDRQNPLNYVSY